MCFRKINIGEMEESDYEVPKKVKYSKVGRPRKYVGGWTSVSNLLVKQIKLHTDVYLRWMRLKGARQHSEFASYLLDIYEQKVVNKRTFEEVVVEATIQQHRYEHIVLLFHFYFFFYVSNIC